MDRLRRTLSFRSRKKKRKQQNESSKPHQWQEDERKVREGTCSFQVKYLGCVEVFESRGMQVCEEAHKVLRHQCKGKYQRAVLYVSGDALRVVDEISKNAKKSTRLSFRKKPKNKQKVLQAILYISGDSLRVIEDKAGITQDDGQGLIVDQTIEKVSFCAPDRNHEKGFSYICRDGTTRRWMCHGFLALKESGERLSHAVGCAFAVCLEKKQKREKEAVSVSYSDDKTSFARLGSFRQATLTERLADPQSTKIAEPVPSGSASPATQRAPEDPSIGIQRPHASANLLLRQGSFREFNKLNSQTSPFKRNLSLRLNDLPSNLTRQQNEFDRPITNQVPIIEGEEEQMSPQSTSTAKAITDSGSNKTAPVGDDWDPIAEMCQQLTKGLTGLSAEESKAAAAAAASNNKTQDQSGQTVDPIKQTNPWAGPAVQDNDFWLPPSTSVKSQSGVTTTVTTLTSTQQQQQNQISRPRPAASGLHHASTYAGPFTTNQQLTNGIKPTPIVTSSNLMTNGSSGNTTIGILSPPTSSPQNPFDTAWALRSTSTNPFLNTTNTVTVSNTSQQQHQQSFVNKEFEIKM